MIRRPEGAAEAVYRRLHHTRGRSWDALLADLSRDAGEGAWRTGLTPALRVLLEGGWAWCDGDGLWRRHRTLEDWVRSLPVGVRSRLSRWDLDRLRSRWLGGALW